MAESRLSVQIDECFIKAIRNESRQRRERFREIQNENGGEKDLLYKMRKLGLITDEDSGPKVRMKKSVVRKLIKS